MWRSFCRGGPAQAMTQPDDLPLLSVAALNRLVSQTLARQFPMVRLAAELSQVLQASSGHWYVTLKDGQASVKAVMFRREAAALRFAPAVGMQVEVRASPGLYEARGEFQLQVLAMQPAGLGSLYELFLKLKARLTEEGLFAADRKRPMPAEVLRIGLLTSASGAALRDFLVTLRAEAPRAQVVLFPTLVQGADAPEAICRALQRAASVPLDALAVVRGGGSLEDLWAFNDERVVRQLCAMPHYTVTGVGHETDTTLVDWVSDYRAATPTAAAHWLAGPERRHLARVQQAALRLRTAMDRRLQQAWLRLDRLGRSLPNPRTRLTAQREAYRSAAARLGRLGGSQGPICRPHLQRLLSLSQRLEALNPMAVLARGYVLVTNTDGTPVVRASEVAPQARLGLVWADGRADVVVEGCQTNGLSGEDPGRDGGTTHGPIVIIP